MKKNKVNLSLSLIIFVVVLIYIVVNVIGFFMRTKLAVYEVKAGSMSDVISTTGIAVRDEKVIKSKYKGYINYYTPELSKVYAGETVYVLDKTGKMKKYLSKEISSNKAATKRVVDNLNEIISDYQDNYNNEKFEEVYSIKQKINNNILNNNGKYLTRVLTKMNAKYGENSYRVHKSHTSGIISTTYDNFSVKDVANIRKEDFERKNYKKSFIASNSKIEKNDSVYRIVKDENWQIVVQLTKKEYEQLRDKHTVSVTFLQDNVTTNAYFQTEQRKESCYGYISLSKYMIRYINDRFLDLEISIGSDDGYKIPKTSIVEKDFYKVPSAYLKKDNNTGSSKVLARTGKNTTPSYKDYTIYRFDQDKSSSDENAQKEDKYFYLDADEVEKNTVLLKDEDSEIGAYTLQETEKQKGVYSINQGYAKFRAIEEIRVDDEFVLIKTDTVQGISLYDHIVQNSSDIDENDIIY